jgi:hypothetical protein
LPNSSPSAWSDSAATSPSSANRERATASPSINVLLAGGVIARQELTDRFFRKKQSWLENKIRAADLADVVLQCGVEPRERILELQSESQMLLLLDWNDEGEKGIYTGKVFEHLAAGRPILTLGTPAGVLKDLMRETVAGAYCRTADEAAAVLSEAIAQYRVNGRVEHRGKARAIGGFSQIEMARKFAEILSSVMRT